MGKVDELRAMRERQVMDWEKAQREARSATKNTNATRAKLEEAVRAVKAKPKRHK